MIGPREIWRRIKRARKAYRIGKSYRMGPKRLRRAVLQELFGR